MSPYEKRRKIYFNMFSSRFYSGFINFQRKSERCVFKGKLGKIGNIFTYNFEKIIEFTSQFSSVFFSKH